MQHDQDVMNYICRNGKVLFIDPRWNVLHDYGAMRYLPTELYNQYVESEKDPYIIHYHGSKKPWKSETSREIEFWLYAIKTPFLKDIIRENTPYLISRKNIDFNFFVDEKIENIKTTDLIENYILYEIYKKNNSNNAKVCIKELLLVIRKKIEYYDKNKDKLDEESKVIYITSVLDIVKTFRKKIMLNRKVYIKNTNNQDKNGQKT